MTGREHTAADAARALRTIQFCPAASAYGDWLRRRAAGEPTAPKPQQPQGLGR